VARLLAPTVSGRVETGPAQYDYAAAMAEVRRQGLTHDLSGEAVGRIFGLVFALEQLGHDLEGLADRVRELAQRPAAREAGT
jgi:hypothetical protein